MLNQIKSRESAFWKIHHCEKSISALNVLREVCRSTYSLGFVRLKHATFSIKGVSIVRIILSELEY